MKFFPHPNPSDSRAKTVALGILAAVSLGLVLTGGALVHSLVPVTVIKHTVISKSLSSYDTKKTGPVVRCRLVANTCLWPSTPNVGPSVGIPTPVVTGTCATKGQVFYVWPRRSTCN